MEKKHSRGLRELPKALLSRKRYDDDSERSETEFSDLERGRSITGTKGKKRVEGMKSKASAASRLQTGLKHELQPLAESSAG